MNPPIFLLLLLLMSCSLLAQTEPEVQGVKEEKWSIHDFRPWLEFDELQMQEEPTASVHKFKAWIIRDSPAGDWNELRGRLAANGVTFSCLLINDFWGNTTGGIKQGSTDNGIAEFASAIDFDKLLGWKGGSFYSSWGLIYGQNASSELVGDIFTISNIAAYNTFRNIELWIQYKICEDKISLRTGQLIADTEFTVSDYGLLFVNSAFGWIPSIYTSILPNGGPNYPLGNPGVRLELRPTESFSFKVAAFQGDAYDQSVNKYGFDWNLNSSQGLFYMTEADYSYGDKLPGQVKGGAWFSSGDFPNANGSGSMLWGNYGAYEIIDQMIYHKPTVKKEICTDSKNANSNDTTPSKGDGVQLSDPGLGVFGRVAFEPEDRNLLSFYCDTGLNYKGLIPTRDQDVFGIALGYGQIGNATKSSQQQATEEYDIDGNLIQVTPGSSGVSYEMAIETTYRIQATPWLTVQPDVQYIIHPGGSQDLANALIVGVRATVLF